MDKQKQIEEMAKALEIAGKVTYFNNGKIDLTLLKTSEEIAETLYYLNYCKIPEGSVVLTREEFSEKIENTWLNCQEFTRKETAEKFARLVEFHSVSTRDNDGREIFTISALCLKEILHEEFGIPYDEICKEFTEM